jgi:hypothetical protein
MKLYRRWNMQISNEDETAEGDEATNTAGTRQRGTINFPYADLDDAVSVAQATWRRGGIRASLDQLAAAMKHKTIASGGFRSKIGAAKLFGLVRTDGMDVSLTNLGQQIVDQPQEARARSDAFLRVPLFRAIYERHRGGPLPSGTALESEMVELGVAPKQGERARQVFQRSAEQAGYFQAGKDRLVQPTFGSGDGGADMTPKPKPEEDEEESLRDHPLIQGLFKMLPLEGPWPESKRQQWLEAARVNLELVYGSDPKVLTSGREQPSERSESAAPGSFSRPEPRPA